MWLKMASGKGPKDRPLNSREVVRTKDKALSTVTPTNQQTDFTESKVKVSSSVGQERSPGFGKNQDFL